MKQSEPSIKKELKRLEHLLDTIKFDLSASVYTLEDDEFETVFYVRDRIHEIIKELEWEGK